LAKLPRTAERLVILYYYAECHYAECCLS
jgi:hypothetical protein